MVGLYQDPEGKHVFTMGGEQSVESREESSTTETLRRRVKELERELEKKVHYDTDTENTAFVIWQIVLYRPHN